MLRLDFKWLAIDDDTEKYLRLSAFLVWLLKHTLDVFIALPAKNFIVSFEQLNYIRLPLASLSFVARIPHLFLVENECFRLQLMSEMLLKYHCFKD